MDKKICPIFYAIMLHRRGRVDDITINDLCECLGEKCQWWDGRCRVFHVEESIPEQKKAAKIIEKESTMDPKPENEKTLQDEEPKDEEKKQDPLFADDESEFSEI